MALSQQELTDTAYEISKRFDKVNTMYIELMAEQVKAIGKLDQDNMHRLYQMTRMGNNIDEINAELSKQTGLALEDIYALYDKSAGEIYKDVAYLYKAGNVEQVPFSKNIILQNYINSVKQLTRGTFVNMANTTVISNSYRSVIDYAIDAVATGVDDYQSVMKKMLLDNARNGARVQYASGYTRRLDSACRMNILEGVRQVNIGIRRECGKQYGADGVEIDAHGLCASDHLQYQGRQYSIEKYNEINSNLARQIGTCNCQHTISYIILGVSPPSYSSKELKDIEDYSNQKITIRDKEVTRYEASQLMRNAETQMRYKQDEIVALQNAGFDYAKQEEQLKSMKSNYYYISKRAGLQPRYDRASVSGYNLSNKK